MCGCWGFDYLRVGVDGRVRRRFDMRAAATV